MSKPKQADLLLALATDLPLFHAPDGTGYARVMANKHLETLAIRGRGFRAWLRQQFYITHHGSPGAQPLQDALDMLDAQALFAGPEEPVFLRIAEDTRSGAIYVDLGDADWTAIEVLPADPKTHRGWRLVSAPPVNFRRTRSMTALPFPERGGSADELQPFVNVHKDDFDLVLAWLIDSLRPSGPHVILGFQGEQGAAKSFTSRVLLSLIDPNLAPLRTLPHDPRDLAIAASNSWALGFDNISKLWPAQSDGLCRLATGAGFSTRQLYTDQDEIVFSGARPIILNGIDNIVERDDLRDRAFLLDLPPVPDTARRAEADLWAAFATARPRILAALLDCVATALRYEPVMRLEAVPRMADACRWIESAAPELGWPAGRFVHTYIENRKAAVQVYVANEIFISSIMELAITGFDGMAGELLSQINARTDETARRGKDWPQNPKAAREAVRRAAGALRALGVEATFAKRRITIQKKDGIHRPDPQTASAQPTDEGADGVFRTQSQVLGLAVEGAGR